MNKLSNNAIHNDTIYDKKVELIHTNYAGFLPFSTFKKNGLKTIKMLQTHQKDAVLVDLRALEIMPQENQQWIQQEWFPKAIASGLKRLAFIVPKSILGVASMENANKGAEKQVSLKYFELMEDAVQWLKEGPDVTEST